MPTWSCHVKPNCRVVFRIEKDPAYPSAVHDHAILFYLCRNALKHGRAEIVPLPVFIPHVNDRGKSQTQRPLLRHKPRVFDRHIYYLFGLCLKRRTIHPSQAR